MIERDFTDAEYAAAVKAAEAAARTEFLNNGYDDYDTFYDNFHPNIFNELLENYDEVAAIHISDAVSDGITEFLGTDEFINRSN